ncbi:MAG: hypothetical protein JWN44_2523 [Myxococcales bacterium]|nr:hypothetical protein [Myxococcales bacterium]
MQQGISQDAAQRLFDAALPRIQPFRDHAVHSTVGVLDWDHRLPSKQLTLRVHVLYDAAARGRFDQALQRRQEEITSRDLYPEFDVPDLAGLPADEAYDVELSALLEIEAMRLTSPWRRDVAEEDAGAAIDAVRASGVFADVKKQESGRSPALGDLEAVAWTPPCESGQKTWTLDVWWLTAFDGRIGRGWSFLVDPSAEGDARVLASREFTVRAG